MAFYKYDPGLVDASFKGVIVQGYAEGSFVKIEYAEDTFSKTVGGAGDVTRVRSRDNTGMITFTIQRGSPTNERFWAYAMQDKASGTGRGPLQVKDHNGKTLIEAPNAWVKKLPDVEYSNDAGTLEWVFECDELFMTMSLPTELA